MSGVGAALGCWEPPVEPRMADCRDSAHHRLAQGLEQAVLSLHGAFGSPWARSWGMEGLSVLISKGSGHHFLGAWAGREGQVEGRVYQPPPFSSLYWVLLDERVGTLWVWVTWGPYPFTNYHSKERGCIYCWGPLMRAMVSDLGSELLCSPLGLLTFQTPEVRDREMRRKGLQGGGALQPWGHPRPPVRCNWTLWASVVLILGLFLRLPELRPSPFT